MRASTKYSRVESITYVFDSHDIKQALLDYIAKSLMAPKGQGWKANTELEMSEDEDTALQATIIWRNETPTGAPPEGPR